MKYFKDVFELKSFTKAANINFVHQSAITQQIASIEKEIGVILFIREHGKIESTLQGEIFYEECVCILEKYKNFLKELKDISMPEPQKKKIVIGFSGAMEDKFSNLVSCYCKNNSDVNLEFVEGNYASLCNKLLNQEIDVVFGAACELENIPGTEWNILFREKQMVLMSKENPLSVKEKIKLEDLEQQTLIVPLIDMVPSCHKKGKQLKTKSKYKIDIKFSNSFEAIKMQVRSNQGVTFAAESFEDYNHEEFKKVLISDIHFVCTLGILHLKDNTDLIVNHFIKVILKESGKLL